MAKYRPCTVRQPHLAASSLAIRSACSIAAARLAASACASSPRRRAACSSSARAAANAAASACFRAASSDSRRFCASASACLRPPTRFPLSSAAPSVLRYRLRKRQRCPLSRAASP